MNIVFTSTYLLSITLKNNMETTSTFLKRMLLLVVEGSTNAN